LEELSEIFRQTKIKVVELIGHSGGEVILELANRGKNLFEVCADNERSIKLNLLRFKFPDRVINVVIAEQSMVATGIATTKKIAFVASYVILNCMRHWNSLELLLHIPN